jgi:uncharacterized repeat protein (TIGR01451 family)
MMGSWERSRLPRRLVFVLLVTALLHPASATIREDEPVLLSGSSLTLVNGIPIGHFGLYRYVSSNGTFEPIPFQIDERVPHFFSGGGSVADVTELIYDILLEDNGLFDGDDELAFMYKDVGPQAPANAPGPPGADSLSYEIRVNDPRPGAPRADGWVYLFTGTGLTKSTDSYVSWGGLETDAMSSAHIEIGYAGRWQLTEYSVLSPCGSGSDLIDRVKARAGQAPDDGESEELWNGSSFYLGAGPEGQERGLAGPIRAIRYVRGAGSGLNTIHHDVFYEKHWIRTVNLRVHPVDNIWHYLDWLPQPGGLQLFTPTQRAGIALDGTPDGPIYGTFEDWNLVRSPEGGMVRMYWLPASPLYQTKLSYMVDDATYNDAPLNPPIYTDDDDQAIGNHGFRISSIVETASAAIQFKIRLFPLCGDVGDADLGDDYQELLDIPLGVTTVPQGETDGSIQTLRLDRDFDDVVLTWLPVSGAQLYRVYHAPDPSMPPGHWTLLDQVMNPEARDVGAIPLPDRSYLVYPVTPDQREMVDLSILKTVDDLGPSVGQDVVFSVAVSNAEKVIGATGVKVTDVLPSGYAYVSDDSAVTGTSYDPGTGVWDVGTIGSNQTVTLHITATVLATGDYTNVAEVLEADQPDRNDVYGDGGGLDTGSVSPVPGSVRTLIATRTADDVVLTWQAISGSLSYRVYISSTPDAPKGSWTLLADVPINQYVDSGAALLPGARFYSIVPVTGAGEGPH